MADTIFEQPRRWASTTRWKATAVISMYVDIAATRRARGDATALPTMTADLATMTGNVAQAIVDPADWEGTGRSSCSSPAASNEKPDRAHQP